MMNPSFVVRASSTATESPTKDEETFTYQAEVRLGLLKFAARLRWTAALPGSAMRCSFLVS